MEDNQSLATGPPLHSRVADSAQSTAEERFPDADLSPQGRIKAAKFVEGFTLALLAVGAPHAVRLSARANILRLCADDHEGSFVKKAKAFVEHFSARVFGTTHPPIRLDGHFGRWCNAHIFRGPRTRMRVALCESLFASKYALGYASDRQVQESLRAHAAATAGAVADGTYRDGLVLLSRFLFSGLQKRMRAAAEMPGPVPQPTSKGGVGCPGAACGKIGYLWRAFHGVRTKGGACDVRTDWTIFRDGLDSDSPPLPQLPGERPDPRGNRFNTTWRSESPDEGVLLEEPRPWRRHTWIDPAGRFHTDFSYSAPVGESRWNAFIIEEALSELAKDDDDTWGSYHVQVTAVQEYGAKVRTVTKGSPAASSYCRGWQSAMFRAMTDEFDYFPSLAGKIDALDIARVLEGHEDPDRFVASSDFRAASDLLDPGLTNPILESMCEFWPGRDIILDDNDDKMIHYSLLKQGEGPRGSIEDFFGVKWALGKENGQGCDWVRFAEGGPLYPIQREHIQVRKTAGQLMGQATSFPLLCLVNLLVSFAAYAIRYGFLPDDPRFWRYLDPREFERRVAQALPHFRVIINGDDRLRLSDRSEEDLFWLLATTVGLHRSPGKSHETRGFAVVNGQRYTYHLGEWVRTPLLRLNLLIGMKKLESDPFRPSEVVTALFETCHWRWAHTVKCLFLSRHGERLEEELNGRALFLPHSLNGAGQERPCQWDCGITPQQRAWAESCFYHAPNALFGIGPLRAPEVNPPPRQSWPWQPPVDTAADVDLKWTPQDVVMNTFMGRLKFNRGLPGMTRYRVWRCPMGHENDWSHRTCRHTDRRVCGAQLVTCPLGEQRYRLKRRCAWCGPDLWGVQCCERVRVEVHHYRACDCHGELSHVEWRLKRRAPIDVEALGAPRWSAFPDHSGDPVFPDKPAASRWGQPGRRKPIIADVPYSDVGEVVRLAVGGQVPLPGVAGEV